MTGRKLKDGSKRKRAGEGETSYDNATFPQDVELSRKKSIAGMGKGATKNQACTVGVKDVKREANLGFASWQAC
jgi:hypothetical protein